MTSPLAAPRVARPRLEEQLSSAHPVVVLVGPCGTGRSSTLAAHVRARTMAGEPVGWVDGPDLPSIEVGHLIIDDAESVDEHLWDELSRLLRRSPDLRLRLATTSLDVLPEDWDPEVVDDLFFTTEETTEHLQARGSVAETLLVMTLTDGHPASVALIAASGAETPEQVNAVLANARAPHRLAAQEERLAVPDHLSRSLVTRLGGSPDFIDRAERAGIGYWTGGPLAPVFVLLPTVRHAARAAMPLTSRERRDLRTTAAEVFLDEGAAFPAFVEGTASGRLHLADRAMKLGGLPLLTGHGYAIVTMLRPLSVRQLGQYPVLAMSLALGLNARRQNRLRALELLGVAVMGARIAQRRSPADRALMRVVESVGLRVSGAADGGVSAARKATQMLAEMTPDHLTDLGTLEPDLRAHAAISLMYGGYLEEAGEQFEQVTGSPSRASVELLALGGLGALAALDGDLRRTQDWLALADTRVWPLEWLDEYPGSLLRIAQAQVAVERSDFAGAHAALDTIWPIIDTIEHWPLLAHVRALADLGTGQAAAGLERFHSLRQRRTGRLGLTAWVQRRLDITESVLHLGMGDTSAAKLLTDSGDHHSDRLLASARVALVADDRDRAVMLLGRARPTTPDARMTRAALQAILFRRLGRAAESGRAVADVAALVTEYGARSPLMLLPRGELALFGDVGLDLPELLADGSVLPSLTPRELVVLQELAATTDVQQMADSLHVSVNTIKSQRRSLYRKLDASTREEALATGLAYGLLDD